MNENLQQRLKDAISKAYLVTYEHSKIADFAEEVTAELIALKDAITEFDDIKQIALGVIEDGQYAEEEKAKGRLILKVFEEKE